MRSRASRVAENATFISVQLLHKVAAQEKGFTSVLSSHLAGRPAFLLISSSAKRRDRKLFMPVCGLRAAPWQRGREGPNREICRRRIIKYLSVHTQLKDWARANSHRVCRHGEKTREAEALSFPFCCTPLPLRILTEIYTKQEAKTKGNMLPAIKEQVNVAIIINFYMEPRRRPTAKLPTDL